MDHNTYTVYVKTDENGVITAINSSAFLPAPSDWVKLDEGEGDRYHHAQNNYLPHGLTDERGLYNYALVGGEITERSLEDKAPELARLEAKAEIAELKASLAATDYIAAKLAEGAATREEYAEQIAQRAEWRAEINRLEVLTDG